MPKIRSERTKQNKARRAAKALRKRTSHKAKARATLRALSNAAKGIPRPSTLAKLAPRKTKPVEQVEPVAQVEVTA